MNAVEAFDVAWAGMVADDDEDVAAAADSGGGFGDVVDSRVGGMMGPGVLVGDLPQNFLPRPPFHRLPSHSSPRGLTNSRWMSAVTKAGRWNSPGLILRHILGSPPDGRPSW